METYKMALLQADFSLMDLKGNLEKALRLSEQAVESGAKLIVLPECFYTGYDGDKLEEMVMGAEDENGICMSSLKLFAKKNQVYLIAPILTPYENTAKNTAFLIDANGEVIGRYDKTHLTGKEKQVFVRGTEYPVFDTPLGKIGILICMDLAYPEPWRILKVRGAELVILCAAWRDVVNLRESWKAFRLTRARDQYIYAAFCNRVGLLSEGSKFSGDSSFMGPKGEIIQEAGPNGEQILYCEVDRSRLKATKTDPTYVNDRHPEEYAPVMEPFSSEKEKKGEK